MINYPFDWDDRDKQRLARTLFRINGDDEFNFMAFLDAELSRLDSLNRAEVDEVVFRQRQGACLAVSKLIKLLEDADETYGALKRVEGVRNRQE